MHRVLEQIKAKMQGLMKRRGSPDSGGGLAGEPGTTQRPGRRSGGPGDGPTTGGSTGPAGPTQP